MRVIQRGAFLVVCRVRSAEVVDATSSKGFLVFELPGDPHNVMAVAVTLSHC